MPVQINEIIIRATVDNTPAGATAAAIANPATSMDTTQLVEQIMENIRNKNER